MKGPDYLVPSNLEEAEALFGSERVRARRRGSKRKSGPHTFGDRVRCEACGKVGYRSEAEARWVIGKMLEQGMLNTPDVFVFTPYLCPRGYWHTGHDYRALARIESWVLAERCRASVA